MKQETRTFVFFLYHYLTIEIFALINEWNFAIRWDQDYHTKVVVLKKGEIGSWEHVINVFY